MTIGRVFTLISIITVVSIAIILILWLIRWWSQGGQFKKRNIHLTGKVAIITGCNTGIGKETAIDLARRGAKVYMACRDKKRAEDARQEIIHMTLNSSVFFIPCDLASFASVRAFVKEFLRVENRLDVLINNAADRYYSVRTESKEGFEMHLAIYLGHFLLTNLLLDTLKSSTPSRIINVTCKSHRYARINNFLDLNSEKYYNQYQAYFQSKLANILFTRSLSKQLQSAGLVCTANSCNPGIIRIELGKHRPFVEILLSPLSLFMKTIKSGAQTIIALAVDPELESVTGKYYVDCKIANESDEAKDDETAEWLWEISEIMTELKAIV